MSILQRALRCVGHTQISFTSAQSFPIIKLMIGMPKWMIDIGLHLEAGNLPRRRSRRNSTLTQGAEHQKLSSEMEETYPMSQCHHIRVEVKQEAPNPTRPEGKGNKTRLDCLLSKWSGCRSSFPTNSHTRRKRWTRFKHTRLKSGHHLQGD